MKWKIAMTLTGGVVLITALSGCSTTEPDMDLGPRMSKVEFAEDEKPGPLKRIENRNDPYEVVSLARSLSAAGRYKDAAEIYLDANDRFYSASGNFEQDCKMAAVREYWLAGELKKAHALLDELEKQQDIYARAAESDDIRKLRRLLRESEAILAENEEK